ncbi:hypothetical protein V6N13_004821 [Hibiscus sabdariffa]
MLRYSTIDEVSNFQVEEVSMGRVDEVSDFVDKEELMREESQPMGKMDEVSNLQVEVSKREKLLVENDVLEFVVEEEPMHRASSFKEKEELT